LAHDSGSWRNPRLRPKIAFSRFPPVHGPILNGSFGSIPDR
jgi:hypothetical protein